MTITRGPAAEIREIFRAIFTVGSHVWDSFKFIFRHFVKLTEQSQGTASRDKLKTISRMHTEKKFDRIDQMSDEIHKLTTNLLQVARILFKLVLDSNNQPETPWIWTGSSWLRSDLFFFYISPGNWLTQRFGLGFSRFFSKVLSCVLIRDICVRKRQRSMNVACRANHR